MIDVDKFRQALWINNATQKSFAEDNGFAPNSVSAVLTGRRKYPKIKQCILDYIEESDGRIKVESLIALLDDTVEQTSLSMSDISKACGKEGNYFAKKSYFERNKNCYSVDALRLLKRYRSKNNITAKKELTKLSYVKAAKIPTKKTIIKNNLIKASNPKAMQSLMLAEAVRLSSKRTVARILDTTIGNLSAMINCDLYVSKERAKLALNEVKQRRKV